MFRLIERHQIECDALQSGTLRAAFGSGMFGICASAEQWVPRRTGGVAGERCGAQGYRHGPLRLCHAGSAWWPGESAWLCARSGTGCDAGGCGGARRDTGARGEAQRAGMCARRPARARRQARAGHLRLHRRCVPGTAPQRRAGVQRDRGERTFAARAYAVGVCTRWGGSRSCTGSTAPTAC